MSARFLDHVRSGSFFQLVRRLLRSRSGAVAPGGAGPADREVVRFRPAASLAFPASDVEEVEVIEADATEGGECYRVTVNFFGLYGPSSPLPNHFTEDVMWAGDEGRAARDFLDIFNHRLTSFIYRAWEKYRFAVQFDSEARDAFTHRMLCLIGLGTRGMEDAAGLPITSLLRAASTLSARQRSAAGLECFLGAQFEDLEIRVEPCVERRVPIPASQQWSLGGDRSSLGHDTCLGASVPDRTSMFRIVLGPLDRKTYRAFLPGGGRFARLARLVRLYVADPLEFELVLRLAPQEVPALRLSPGAALPLGRMSWLAPRGAGEGRAGFATRDVDPLACGARPEPGRGADADDGRARPAPFVETGLQTAHPRPGPQVTSATSRS